jgi:hypothetical protein
MFFLSPSTIAKAPMSETPARPSSIFRKHLPSDFTGTQDRASTDTFWTWERDSRKQPVLELAYGREAIAAPRYRHLLNTGRLALLADALGNLQFFTHAGGVALPFNSQLGPDSFLVRIGTAGYSRTLTLAELNPEETGRFRCGIGTLDYEARVQLSPEIHVDFSLGFSAPPDQSWMLAELQLLASADTEVTLEIFSDALPSHERFAAKAFCKDGVAMIPDFHPETGDYVLGGGPHWQAASHGARLHLSQTMQLASETPACERLLVGYGKECSLDWVHSKLEQASAESIAVTNAARLAELRVRAPELWMQDECAWDTARLLSFAVSEQSTGKPTIHSGASGFFPERTPQDAADIADELCEQLKLCLPLAELVPQLALNNFLSVAARQHPDGRLPNRQTPQDTSGEFNPEKDRSDLEIWLLVAGTRLLKNQQELQDQPLPYSDGSTATLWEHLLAAVNAIRCELRTGLHDLPLLLAGDTSPFLNAAGRGGAGESVLNAALLCFALRDLGEIARLRHEQTMSEQLSHWYQALQSAVGNCFDQGWFVRAYTDRGKAIGGSQDGRLFLDVQAWAVLAKCGTVDQRRQALQSALIHNLHGHSLCCVSPPYPIPAPESISRSCVLTGEGANGGVSLPCLAWFVWALSEEGLTEEAHRQWRSGTLRERLISEPGASPASVHARGEFNSPLAGHRYGTAPCASDSNLLPKAAATAWQSFGMSQIIK